MTHAGGEVGLSFITLPRQWVHEEKVPVNFRSWTDPARCHLAWDFKQVKLQSGPITARCPRLPGKGRRVSAHRFINCRGLGVGGTRAEA